MTFEDISKSAGKDMFLSDDTGWNSNHFKAFIQPLRYKNKMYLDGAFTEIGRNTGGYYLYIGPPNHDITIDTTKFRLTDIEKKTYIFTRAEKFFIGNEPFYIWAILREANEVSV